MNFKNIFTAVFFILCLPGIRGFFDPVFQNALDGKDFAEALRIIEAAGERKDLYRTAYLAYIGDNNSLISEYSLSSGLATDAALAVYNAMVATGADPADFIAAYPEDSAPGLFLRMLEAGKNAREEERKDLTRRLIASFPLEDSVRFLERELSWEPQYLSDRKAGIAKARENLELIAASCYKRSLHIFILWALKETGNRKEFRTELSKLLDLYGNDGIFLSRAAGLLRDSEHRGGLYKRTVGLLKADPEIEVEALPGQPEWLLSDRKISARISILCEIALYGGTSPKDLEGLAGRIASLYGELRFPFDTDACVHFIRSVLYRRTGADAAELFELTEVLKAGDERGYWESMAKARMKRILGGALYFLVGEAGILGAARRAAHYTGPVFERDRTFKYSFSRIAAGDVDGNGLDDLLLDGRTLLLNFGTDGFRDSCREAFKGIGGTGGIFGDMNNDGRTDIFCWSHDPSRCAALLACDSGFRRIELFPPPEGRTEAAAFAAYGENGFLALYLANYEAAGTDLGRGTPDDLYRYDPGKDALVKDNDILVHNDPYYAPACGRGVSPADFDGDGDQDIYVSNYRLNGNYLYLCEDGIFIERAREKALEGQCRSGYYGHTIGSDWGDLDNDGDLDLVTANLAHPRFIEFSNRTFVYENAAGGFLLREDTVPFSETHSDVTIADFNNDGIEDIYFTCVYPGRRSFLYLGRGDFTFTDITYLSGSRLYDTWGVAALDADGDGMTDLAAGGAGSALLKNVSRGIPPSITVLLEIKDAAINSTGAGLRVLLTDRAGKKALKEVRLGKGTGTQGPARIVFGTGIFSFPVNITVMKGERTIRQISVESVAGNPVIRFGI